MDSYIICLALSYLNEQDRDYDFNDLANLLGFNQLQLDKLMAYLQKNEFVEYKNYELKITDKGLMHLIAKNQINSSLEDAELCLPISTQRRQCHLIRHMYPRNFLKRYNGNMGHT